MKTKIFIANSILATASILFGLLICNQALIFLSSNNSQRSGFPRKSLKFIDPLARWNYPDYNNSDNKQDVTFIVGDSYAEGAGDSFLNNEYEYSIGHFLNNEWRKNTNLYLAANSASNIPLQLSLLKMHLGGELSPISVPPKTFNNLNVILYFYEGNDLENTITTRLSPSDYRMFKLRSKFPLIHAGRTVLSEVKWKLIYAGRTILSKFNLKSTSEKPLISSPNKMNNICIGTTCRKLPPMQSASAGLSEKQISNEINYLIDSIEGFSLEYPKANMCFVYIPSPSTIYSPENDFYFQEYPSHTLSSDIKIDSKTNNSKSLLIRNTIRERLDANSMVFVDTTNILRKESKNGFIHGAVDPKHFNADGYKLVASITAQSCLIE